MSTFKSNQTGDVITVFGVLHDHYVARADFDLVDDDRDGAADTEPQPEVLDDPTDSEGSEPEDSQDPAPAGDSSVKPRSTK